ncbi:MAG: hypothetical protein HRJ53_09590 [Acidobacteria bacterium Pan2503]|uniref:Glycoside hydrolase family 65 N-terminal domain-containing protein n=1 Tax=Candidatus Acidiferrum panamense TaxID=2741543 RepID=A0A7V8NPN8_9BACT|nr:hypothetical protein [Candidatus Acidoferrum panamensis]
MLEGAGAVPDRLPATKAPAHREAALRYGPAPTHTAADIRSDRKAPYPPFWSASVLSVSARCSVQNWPIGRTPVDAPAGRTVRVCSVRLVSFTHRPVAAICYEVEPVDGPARSTVQSELTANEQLPPAGADPRVAAALEDPLRGEYHDATGTAVVLVHKTRRSGLRVGAAIDHLVDCPAPVRAESRFADGGLVTAATVLAPGQKLRVIKFGG